METKTGTDITLLGNNRNFAGILDVQGASTLRADAADKPGTANVKLAGNMVLTADKNWTLSNTVTGSGELHKTGKEPLPIWVPLLHSMPSRVMKMLRYPT